MLEKLKDDRLTKEKIVLKKDIKYAKEGQSVRIWGHWSRYTLFTSLANA